MHESDSTLQDLAASFFDARILSLIRSAVMMHFRPIDSPGTNDQSRNLTPEITLWRAKYNFIRQSLGLGEAAQLDEKTTEDFKRLGLAVEHKEDEFDDQITEMILNITCRFYVWQHDSPLLWTLDRHLYGLLYQAFGDIGVYYILHLTRKTIVFIDHEDVMDNTIEELLRIGAPVYTEVPWPFITWAERKNQMRRHSANNKEPS